MVAGGPAKSPESALSGLLTIVVGGEHPKLNRRWAGGISQARRVDGDVRRSCNGPTGPKGCRASRGQARGQNPLGIRTAMHPRWPLRFTRPHCKVYITSCNVCYTFCHFKAALCVAPRANSAAIPPSSRLASPAPRRSRCSGGFIHGLLGGGLGGPSRFVDDFFSRSREAHSVVRELRKGLPGGSSATVAIAAAARARRAAT